MLVSLRNALNMSALEGELTRIRHSRSGTLGFGDIITKTPQMQAVLRTAEKAAASSIPVLVSGESGVGKELIARAIHGSGERRAKPFVAVNCGAMPENLIESILFGHERGSFTGATERHVGKFIEASGGTLFLDEVGELPPAAQVKLLRAIQEGEVEPVGARKPVKVDVRIVSATNRDLIADVKAGRFREDLFYRLHVFPITVPPLRDRPADIPALARRFLALFAAEEGRRIRLITPEALSVLCAYQWPGNIRQLENAVFRAVVLAEGDTLGLTEFPQIAAQMSGSDVLSAPDQSHERLVEFGRAPAGAVGGRSSRSCACRTFRPGDAARCAADTRRQWRRAPAGGGRGRPHTLCDHPLSGPDVRGSETAADRPLYTLSQARIARPSRAGRGRQ